jgi:hypothetical protein
MIREEPELELVTLPGLGEFALGPVHGEWLADLVPSGYRNEATGTWRPVIPIAPPPTVDIPDLAVAPSDGRDPAWRWLVREWDFDIPSDSHLVTTLGVLTGSTPVTIFRWEIDQWEALDKPAVEVDHSDARVAPIGVLSAIVDDWSLFLRLPVGAGPQYNAGQWTPAWARCGDRK